MGREAEAEAVVPSPRIDDPWDAPVSPASGAAAPFAYPGAADPSALVPWMDDILPLGTRGTRHNEAAPSTSHRAAPETRVADSGPPIPRGAKYDPRWVSLAQGSIREAAAPKTVRLPDEVDKDLGESWKDTAKDGNEHGGNIVRTYGGAAVEAGTQAAASKYHLLYYSGKGANLSRVGGPPPAKK